MTRRSGPLLLAGLLAALLLVLASLQWRWLGQISADERDRMQASLRSHVEDFTQEFDRELTRAYFWLQVDRGPSPTVDASSTGHFQRWFTQAPHPGLVRAIHVLSIHPGAGTTGSTVTLSTYDRSRDALVGSTVPDDVAALVERLRVQPVPTFDKGPTGMPAPVASEGPALVIPRPPVPVVGAGGAIVFSRDERPWDYTIAVLDTAYMREAFLPELLKRHFGEGKASTYRVSVVDRQSGAPVFCSDGAASRCTIAKPDASESFFEVRMREFNRFVVVDDRRTQQGRPGQARPADGPVVAGALPPPGPAAPPHAGGPPHPGPGGPRMQVNVLRQMDDRGRRGDHQELWRANFAHNAGSLEAVVATTRRRNLFVSTSVLLLLGASMSMLLISSTRARKLAAQQMEFVAGVSHELRTPLAVIRSAAENLADGVVGDTAQVQRYGQLIASEGRRLTEMVEQVMEFAGFDAGRTLDTRPVAAVEVAQTAVEASGPLLTQTDTHVDFESPDTPLVIKANHPALARSVQNLISNAVKYGGPDRWVGLRVAPRDGRMVAISVSDHGDGIPEQDLPRIFEPFFRGRHATDGHVPGSGLGLSLVDRIVRQHGGRVEVQSSARGTTFTLLVPSAPDLPVTAPVDEPLVVDSGLARRGQLS
ncbi:MAG TPA: HAMP domain-containing sensor histidine kinase [Luteitalea sp.]|nr:HAMP domain-containing sensor histidine kinase [Luteitalea sp.]